MVSVVVPVLNAAGEIGRLLQSLLALDWPPERLEILVVDNASTDGTPGVVADHPVRLLQETRVQSSYAARNTGVAAARGEWIAFTDADCVARPDWLRRLLLPPPGTEVGAVAGEVLALERTTPVQRLMERHGFMQHAVTLPHKQLPCFSTANVAVRRDLLLRLGGFRQDVRYFADMELSWRLQISGGARILFRPEAVILHRHRRTWGELWRQACQHGRGVAFMRREYPDHYRISLAEQARRVGGLARAVGRALTGGGGEVGRPGGGEAVAGGASGADEPRREGDPDRLLAPFFLALWYAGLLTGYLMGPARSTPPASEETGAKG